MAIHVDFACNNPDNGIGVGKFHMLQVRAGADYLEFDGPWYQRDGITLMVDSSGRFASVGRIKVPILGYKAWVGNWCWDSIAVRWPDMLKLIADFFAEQEKRFR